MNANAKATVLVVDDNEKNLLALKASLEPLGHEIICVDSGLAALRELLRREISVVVLDVQMPGMTGLEVAQAMKSRDRTRYVPIIFVTAISREMAYVMKGYEEGAVDYLLKPVEPAILAAKVKVFADLWLQSKLLEQRAQELERARAAEEQARRDAQFEQELMAIVGHDIRSPLSVIAATGTTLLKRFEDDAAAERGLRRMLSSGRRLEELSSLLLDYTRARMGRSMPLSVETVDVAQLCRSVAGEVSVYWPEKIVCASSAEPLLACVDEARTRQLLTNLLDNASKHGAKDARVTVSLRAAGEDLVLSVHNDGAPIPEAARAQLFEPFSRRSEGTSQASPSVGLGLFIVKTIAEAHGGVASFESEEGLGTTFTIVFPRAIARAAQDCNAASGAPA